MNELSEQVANLSPDQRDLLVLLLSKKKKEADSGTEVMTQSRETDAFPLSFSQQRLWFLNQLQPDNAAYNMAGGVRLSGRLDIHALERALVKIISRHEALRTTFKQIDSEPVQVIGPKQTVSLPSFALQSLPAARSEAEAMMLAAQEARQPFDLKHGPLFRAKLLLLAEQEHILLLTMHHIIFDGWSMGIFVRELAALYEAYATGKPSPLAEAPVQYADFAVWQRRWLQGEVLDKQITYWKKKLGGAPSLLELPTDHPRPAMQSFRGAKHPLSISPDLTHALREMCGHERATLFMALLATFNVLLYRYTNQPDIVVGVPVTGRNRPGLEESIGFFVNTLALRTGLSGDATFRDLLAQVRVMTLEAFDQQDLPFEKLVEIMHPKRDISHTPLFQVMFNLQNIGTPAAKLMNLKLTPFEIDNGTTKFDLTLDLVETAEELKGWIDYNSDLFDASTIQRMTGHFKNLLAAVAANPLRRISDLPLLTPAEEKLQVEWNLTDEVYPQPPCIHQIFEEQVERTPDAPALVFEDESLTYRELNARANQLAHYLRGLGVGTETLVGVLMERSPELIVALLGILKAGAAYVPLDSALPAARLSFMLADTGAPVVLTQQALAGVLAGESVQVVCLDGEDEEMGRQSAGNPLTEVRDENLAYVIYTSGSTGQPKGAMLHHRGVRNRLLWGIADYRLSSTDAVLYKTPLSFDVSVWEIFAPLLSGARLIIARPGGHQDSAYQIKLMAEQHVTHVDFVPSMLQVFLDEEGLERCSSLKLITCAGEALSVELRDRFYARTDARMYNLYGPTEASLAVTYQLCERTGTEKVIPIGRPMRNVRIYLLDQYLRPVPVGIPGELHIGGVAPGRGYLNGADLTGAKFIPDPFSESGGERLYKTGDLARYQPDGAIQFLGRIDHQVKIRGMRLEPGEVEAVLGKHADVKESVVLAREIIPGEKSLVAYVVSVKERVPTKGELQAFLRERLPEYMVPAAFVILDQIPLMPNGKVNRSELPPPEDFRTGLETSYVAPQTDVERTIAAIWRKVFNVDKVGIHSNFFDLGGSSLLLAQVHTKLRASLNRELQMIELFKHPTIHSLAEHLAEADSAQPLPDPGRGQAEIRKKLMRGRKRFGASGGSET
jgi:amino acid adenylation domain-containing protein